MANICSNAFFCKDTKSLNLITSFIDDGKLNYEMIVPEPKSTRDYLKEITDIVDDLDEYYVEKYNIKDLWRKYYWGTTSNRKVEIKDFGIITFETLWNPPYGIVKALWDKGAEFDFYYNDEADKLIHDLYMESTIKMESKEITDVEIINTMADLFGAPFWVNPDCDE